MDFMRFKPSDIHLRVVALDQVRLHEASDLPRVKRLANSLKQQKVQKNPLIVAENDGYYIVLDGATRAAAFRKLGIPDVLVQVVSYEDPDVHLDKWHHVIIGFEAHELLSSFQKIPHLTSSQSNAGELKHALDSRRCLFGLITGDGDHIVYNSEVELMQRMEQLNKAVGKYCDRVEILRTADIELSTIQSQFPDMSAVVLFPRFLPEDVILCAHSEIKFPAGISRHLVGGRALGLNISLEFLTNHQSLEKKNAWLKNMIKERQHSHKVRLYEEPTLVFDE